MLAGVFLAWAGLVALSAAFDGQRSPWPPVPARLRPAGRRLVAGADRA
jgi:hypothetical protein